MTYKSRNIKIQFTLSDGKTFDDSENNVLTVENMRCYIEMESSGGITGTQIMLKIWGLSVDKMAVLSYRGVWSGGSTPNRIRVWADDRAVFEGFISDASANFNEMPDVALILTASMMYGPRLRQVSPFSAKGDVDINDIIKTMATQAGMGFESNGATGKLTNPYFDGDIVTQILSATSAVSVVADIEPDRVIIWPRGKPRRGTTLIISRENGMIGYPVFTNVGLIVTTTFSPEIVTGRHIKIQTDLPNASGDYYIIGAKNFIASKTEGGQWYSVMSVAPVTGNDNGTTSNKSR